MEKMKSPALESNDILFGSDPTERIVAVEPVDGSKMRLFMRRKGGVESRDEIFHPFMIIEDEALLDNFNGSWQTEGLSGANEYRHLVFFENWSECQRAKTYLHKKTGKPPSSPRAPYLFVSDPVHQYLLLTGKTLFKGLLFDELHRMALDIETFCAPGYEFPNPLREEDRIISVAIMDNRGNSQVFFGRDMNEEEMLLALGEKITSLDPDVLEGHNIFNFDLEYIAARARMYGIPLNWGRDGSRPKIRRSRFNVAERIIDYTRFEIFGRHVVDTMFLLQYYDVTARKLESYGLKSAARHFGISDDERTYIRSEDIKWTYDHRPGDLKKYNLDDAKETLGLSELLGYSFFLQARIFPFSYQNIFVRGNATKIDALFLREYLRKRESIPKPAGRRAFEGGYTDTFVKGVVQNVIHCDVASLYPSILLTYGLNPSREKLGIFLPLLGDLRTFRMEAKTCAGEAASPQERDYFEALQQTFKILINSFYGYLGTEHHHFSDPELAAEVTRQGRHIIRQMLQWLREHRAIPIEIDTDGIYFIPPPGMETETAAQAFVERLSESLPEGIEVAMDGRYRAMFSYKSKNYALLDFEGNMIIKGSALRSRGMEKYLRDFLSSMIRLLLEGRGEQVYELLNDYMGRLENHRMGISNLAKTETLAESPEIYRQKVSARKRNPSATYELALLSEREYRAGDQISYYVTGEKKRVRVYDNCKLISNYDPEHPDENIAYYKDKLMSFFKKFEEYVPHAAGQQAVRGKTL